jgi:ribosome-interacting GTPase 1
MPANLPPPYLKADERYRAAVTPEEKITALEEMIRLLPKHKGTDRLQGDLKARLAKLKRTPRQKAGARSKHIVPREGAGQVALVGPPNSGKSALVDSLTHAEPVVADYPFSTREAQPGMMAFEDVSIQLVDMPPVSTEHVEPWVFDLVRHADLVWVVLDAQAALEGWEMTQELLHSKRILLHPPGSDPSGDDGPGMLPMPTLLIVTGLDRPGAEESLEAFRELAGDGWTTLGVAALEDRGLEPVRKLTFEALGVMRVYTKEPGKDPDLEKPFTLPHGSTVLDLAGRIHKDVLAGLRFAKLWGPGVFDGQRVQVDHVLLEGNVVELHH